ncbi:MAG: ADP-ribosylglycohydrolase family protein [Methanomicrobiaceae archaeon]|nr:ADP-ribosylglycohydrolase family protein [Methanomicrobiaceae archaeon]
MLDQYRGSLLGAAIGDALGMPGETGPSMLRNMKYGFRKAWKVHPNAKLRPGQFTDDTQMTLLVARLLAEKDYSRERYRDGLAGLCAARVLRFPDVAVANACGVLCAGRKDETGDPSPTAGCVNLGLPFALASSGENTWKERLIDACTVTHTHPAAHGGALAFAVLIRSVLRGSRNAPAMAQREAATMDEPLAGRIAWALELEEEGHSPEAAFSAIGNDSSVYRTLPLAWFLIRRYEDPGHLLDVAANLGGNSDTIAFICGAYAGARDGARALPSALLEGVEKREEIASIAERLHTHYAEKN